MSDPLTKEEIVDLADRWYRALDVHAPVEDFAGVIDEDTAVALGFTRRPAAAGQVYHLAMIDPTIRHAVHDLARQIGDGRPEFRTFAIPTLPTVPRPCSAGIGTKGGRSRGKGSGSRMRLWECECTPKPVKVRVASDDFHATCDLCHASFKRR